MSASLAVNEATTYRWTLEEETARLAALGIPAIGLWRPKLSDLPQTRVVDLLRESGLQVSSLMYAGGFTGCDGRKWKESVADAAAALQLAAELRAGCLVACSGPRGGHTRNHANRLLKAALKELLPLAEEFMIPIALEPVHSSFACEWSFLTNLSEAAALVQRYNNPFLRLVLDLFHFGHQLADLSDAQFEMLVPHLALVQIADSYEPPCGEPERAQLGAGTVPLAPILARLAEHGYHGPFELELMGGAIEQVDYEQLVATSRDTFQHLLEDAVA